MGVGWLMLQTSHDNPIPFTRDSPGMNVYSNPGQWDKRENCWGVFWEDVLALKKKPKAELSYISST